MFIHNLLIHIKLTLKISQQIYNYFNFFILCSTFLLIIPLGRGRCKKNETFFLPSPQTPLLRRGAPAQKRRACGLLIFLSFVQLFSYSSRLARSAGFRLIILQRYENIFRFGFDFEFLFCLPVLRQKDIGRRCLRRQKRWTVKDAVKPVRVNRKAGSCDSGYGFPLPCSRNLRCIRRFSELPAC